MLSLRISPINNAAGAAHYFFKQDNYYFTGMEGQQHSAWWGKGATSLGLVGQIDEKTFAQVLEGRLPNGAVIGLQKDGTTRHRGGYDLTFSAPKSVSLLALVLGNKSMVALHDKAVDKVLSVIEENAASARTTVGGKTHYEKTNNVIIAKILHDTSRELDPQLHTHALLMNVTQRHDGKWCALASDLSRQHGVMEWISDNKIYLGMIYRSVVAYGLKHMGYEIERTGRHGLFEIKGIAPQVLKHFSKRREQIETQIGQMSSLSSKAFDRATMDTRSQKTAVNRGALMTLWQDDLKSLGLNQQTLEESLKSLSTSPNNEKPHAPAFITQDAGQAVKDAIAHLEEKRLSFSYQEVLTEAMRFTLSACPYDTLIQAIDKTIEKNTLIPLDKRHTRLTTQSLIATEKQLIDTLETGKGARPTELPQVKHQRRTVHNAKEGGAANSALTSTDCFVRIKQTGNNNSELLADLFHQAEVLGHNTVIVSPTRTGANDIKLNVKHQPKTLWQKLATLGKPEIGQTVAGFIREAEDNRLLWGTTKNGVVIVDDAQRLKIQDFNQLLMVAKKQNTKMVFLDKTTGLKGFASDVSTLMDKAQIQTHTFDASSSKQLSVELIEAKTKDERLTMAAKAYSHLPKAARAKSSVVTISRADAKILNDEIRAALKATGELSGEDKTIHTLLPAAMTTSEKQMAKHYQKGMVIYRGQHGRMGRFEVREINKKTNSLLLEDAKGRRQYVATRQFSGKTHVYNEAPLSLAVGERLKTVGAIKRLGIQSGQRYTVSQLTKNGVKLSDGKRTLSLSDDELHHAPLTHDYVTTLHGNIPARNQSLLAVIPAYAATRNVLSTLEAHTTDRLLLFTDDKARLSKAMAKLAIGDTVIDRVGRAATEAQESSISHDAQTVNNPSPQPFHEDKLKQNVDYLQSLKPETNPAQRALHYAITKLSERDAGFTHGQLVEAALAHAVGEVSLDEIELAIGGLQSKGELINANNLWTTKEALTLERSILSQVKEGRGTVAPLLDKNHITAQLANKGLTPGQCKVSEHIITTSDRFVLVQGFAGTGKTTLLTQVKNLLPNTTNMLGVAPTHEAVKQLRQAGIKAQTLKSFLLDQDKYPESLASTLLVLDESSMVGNRDAERFVSHVTRQGGRAVMLGDTLQHLSIESGKPFAVLQKEGSVDVAYTKDIVRQQPAQYKQAVYQVIENQTREALQTIGNISPKEVPRQAGHIQTLPLKSSVVEVVASAPPTKSRQASQAAPTPQTPSIEHHQGFDRIKNSDLLTMATHDYLSRPASAREQTALIIHANADREIANAMIREGLKAQQMLESTSITLNRLVSTDQTTAELYHIESFKECIDKPHPYYLKLGKQYHRIDKVDSGQRVLHLTNEKGKPSLFLPEKHDKDWGLELFESKPSEINVGEQIRLRKTDKDRGHFANEALTVTAITDKHITVENKDKQNSTLGVSTLADNHWDYRYTTTSYGMQGASTLYVIDVENTERKHLTHLRGLYIGLSRGTRHAMIYTNDRNTLMRQINKIPNKYSALEVVGEVGKVAPTPEINHEDNHPNNTPSKAQTTPNNKVRASITPYLDANTISEQLGAKADSVALHLLGKPNASLSSSNQWRYGARGSLAINIAGKHGGTWKNFETDERGNLLTLIQKELGLGFKEALDYAAKLTGEPGLPSIKSYSKNSSQLPKKPSSADSKTHDYALKLEQQSQPLTGTLAEKYLKETRHILQLKTPNLRYHPKVACRHDNKTTYRPALVAIAKNHLNQTKAVQVTYLDKTTANKADVQVKKRTYASPKGAGVLVSDTKKEEAVTYLAEGVETALSIADAMDNARVMAVLGKANFKHIDLNMLTKRVVFCLDNDGKPIARDKVINQAIEDLTQAGKKVAIAMPNDDKSDFNDVAKSNGSTAVKSIIDKAVTTQNKLQNLEHPSPQIQAFVEKKQDKIDELAKSKKGSTLDGHTHNPAHLHDNNNQKPPATFERHQEPNTTKTMDNQIQISEREIY